MGVVFILVGLLAAPTLAQQYGTETCEDFETQEDAQAALDDGNGNPELLDEDGDGIACNENDEQSGTCESPESVVSFGPETEDQITDPFEITGNTFRISYEVESLAEPEGFPFLDITVFDEDEFPVEFIVETEEGQGSENVLEGTGTFNLEIEAEDARYTITVEDCVDDDSDAGNDENGDDETNDDDVIDDSVPDKDLPETGGVPLLGVAALVIAGAGLLTAVVRRRQ